MKRVNTQTEDRVMLLLTILFSIPVCGTILIPLGSSLGDWRIMLSGLICFGIVSLVFAIAWFTGEELKWKLLGHIPLVGIVLAIYMAVNIHTFCK